MVSGGRLMTWAKSMVILTNGLVHTGGVRLPSWCTQGSQNGRLEINCDVVQYAVSGLL